MENRSWQTAHEAMRARIIQDVSVLTVVGDIDMRAMGNVKDAIEAMISAGRTKIVLDFKGVDSINYLSIGILVERLRLLRTAGGDLKLSGMNRYIKQVFALTGFDHWFEDYAKLEDAIESFLEEWECDGVYH